MTDKEKILVLQKEYRDGNRTALGQVYEILYKIAYKDVNKVAAKDSHIRALSPDERKEKAHNAATYIIEQFLRRPEFMTRDATLYLYRRVQCELYGVRKCDKMLVYSDDMSANTYERQEVRFIVENLQTGKKETFTTLYELRAKFKNRITKKQLLKCIDEREPWAGYLIDVLEIGE